MSHELIEADVLVAGAGLSGLVAAAELERAGFEVVVLEARDRVGGRLLNTSLGTGRVVDLGGAYFGPAGHVVERLSRELGIASHPTYEDGFSRCCDGDRVRSYRGFVPPLAPHALLDVGQALRRLERFGRDVPLGEPWAARRAAEWDSQTLASWIRRNLATSAGRRSMHAAAEGMFGASAAEISLLHALSYASSNGGFQYVLSIHEGSQQRRFVGGAQGLALRMAERLSRPVRRGSAVRKVERRGDRVVVRGDGFCATARRVVMALPMPLARRLTYEPRLPAAREQLMARMLPGTTTKCLAVYDAPFWRADGFNGEAISTADYAVARAVIDATPPEGDPGVLEVFVFSDAARHLAMVGARRGRETVLAELARFFGPRALRPSDFLVQDWTAETYTGGCYHAVAQCGVYFLYGPSLRAPVDRLHWAGSEAGRHAMGSMGGAIDAGRRVAAEIATAEAQQPSVAELASA